MSNHLQQLQLRKLAQTSSFPPFDHKFVSTGCYFECSLDPTLKIEFGEVEYGSPNFVMHGGVQMKDWLFCLEQSTIQPGFFLCAFVGREHFTFGRIIGEDLRTAQRNFVSTCMNDFCGILYERELRAIEEKTGDESFTWKKNVPKKEPKE